MSTKTDSQGDVLTLTAPSGGVVSGTGYKIGRFFGIAQITAAVGLKFTLAVTGVQVISKVNLEPWTEGLLIWYNTASSLATSISTTSMLIGASVETIASGTATGRVRLNGAAGWLNQ